MPKEIFSNGSEYRHWQTNNCDKCKKYESESIDADKCGCKAAFYMDLGSITGEWPKIIYEITGDDFKCKSISPNMEGK